MIRNLFVCASLSLTACSYPPSQPDQSVQAEQVGPVLEMIDEPRLSAEALEVKPIQAKPVEIKPARLIRLPALERYEADIDALCEAIGAKLGSVSVDDCHALRMQSSGVVSAQQRPLAIREFLPLDHASSIGRVLVIGGIHGDEYSSVSIVFKWMKQLSQDSSNQLHWRFMPSVNPDGLLVQQSTRQNANGVDLNRNFPSRDWDSLAIDYWHSKASSSPRRNPGRQSASESETRGLMAQIEAFKPDVIVSIHAPYHLLDYDGPLNPPAKIGDLHLHELGVYPGSLGNYAGADLRLPVVTLELPYAGIMPKPATITHMWSDLNLWVQQQLTEKPQHKDQVLSVR